LPVYRLLEWGVRQGVTDSVIADTDELVALTLPIRCSTTSRARSTSRAPMPSAARPRRAPPMPKTPTSARILSKGIEQLRELRDEVLRQRAQMRQSYMAAMSQANLSASYAGVVRQRDRDARDAAGANANRNQ
jgi:conjugative transfer pilus assembly protein TraH